MVAVAAVALAVAACSGGSSPRANPAADETTTTTLAAPAAYEPLYVEGACPSNVPVDPRVTCGGLTVPEDRSKPTGRTVRLPVAVLHSVDPAPAPDPIVYFSGGPGYSGLDNVGLFMRGDLGGRRDVIFFDQRGTGGSDPSLDCPEVHEATATILSAAAPFEEEQQTGKAALLACRDRLRAQGVDLEMYDTPTTGDDVADLKRALGIDEWNLFGVSYGTTVALEVLRSHPDGVRSAVIDSVFPTTVHDGLEGLAASLERVLGVFYGGCAADPACASAYPTLQQDVDALIDSLTTEPYHGHIANPVLGREQDIAITGADALAGLFTAFYDSGLIPSLPQLIEVVRSGEGGGIIDQLAVEGIDFTNGAAEAETAAVTCADRQRFFDPNTDAALLAEHPEYTTLAVLGGDVCDEFDVEPVPESFNDAVHSDIPTLVLADEYDPVTPPPDSKAAADALAESTFVLFPGLGHGAVFAADCPRAIYLAFVDDPSSAVDTSCVATMGPPRWSTGS